MFRKGGPTNTMTGIMSGIQDRNNYQDAGRVADQGFDPLTSFLLQYGPALASARPTGNVLSTAVGAAAKPIETLLTQQAAERKFQKEKALQEELLAKEFEGKEKLLEKEIAGRKEIVGMEKGQGIFSTKDFFDEYGSKVQAENRANYENLDLETKANEAFGQSYEGFIGGKHGRLKDYEKKNNIGKVYYDVTDGSFKRLRRTKDGYEYEPINLGTFDPEADKAAKVKKEDTEKTFPMFSGTKPKKTLKEAFDIGDVPPFDPYGGA
jgi:hypothetical protein